MKHPEPRFRVLKKTLCQLKDEKESAGMHSSFWRLGKRTAWLLSSVAVLGLVLSGSAFAAAHAVKPASKAQKLTSVSVQLNWLTNVEFSGLWVADHLGWFKKAGFKLKATGWSNGINPEDVTSACYQGAGKSGNLCFGYDDSAAVAIARSQGNDLKAVWVGSQKTPFAFATCAVTGKKNIDSKCKSNTHKNITSPKQWKGLKIGYQSHELYVPEVMLGSVKKSLSDVKPVTVQFDTSVLTTGGVDAFLVFLNNEPISLALQGVHTNVIPAYKFGFGDFYADTMFAPSAELKAYPKKVKTFVSLVDQGWKYAMHHANAVGAMVQKYYFKTEFGAPSSRIQQQKELGVFAKTLSRDGSGKISGRMTLKRWEGIIHILRTYPGDIGGRPIISHSISASASFTNQFAPAAAK
jgi:ABC-type nitrate/sulfonate/bicarbonate transport system substrate-binding protein